MEKFWLYATCSGIENRMPIFSVTLITFKQTISPVLEMRTYSEEQQYDVGKKKKNGTED